MARATKSASASASSASGKKAATKAAPAKAAASKATRKAAPAKKAAPAAKAGSAKAAKAAKATKKAAPAKKAVPARKPTAAAATTKKAPSKAPGKPSTDGKAANGKAAPAKTRSPFPAKFLVQQEKALLEERATYTRQFESLRAEADALVADFESGDVQFDEESGEGDTINIERERDIALSEQARQAIGEIDHALSKFGAGTYGICEVSGDPIPPERLEAIPWARERVEYKTGGLTRR